MKDELAQMTKANEILKLRRKALHILATQAKEEFMYLTHVLDIDPVHNLRVAVVTDALDELAEATEPVE